VEPLGFEITDAHLRRAGLDYWEHLQVVRHKDVEAFLAQVPINAKVVFLSKKAGRTHYEEQFEPGTWIVFGKETAGLPDWILNRYTAQTVRIPMYDARVRSLNLSNAVSICVYEAIRQLQSSSPESYEEA
jgi:tRNA (cytidine/uridine-2'-O-)-methyltransferase